jgi:hypothetical protein
MHPSFVAGRWTKVLGSKARSVVLRAHFANVSRKSALKSQHLWKWCDAQREKRAVAGTRAIRSSRLAIAALRRSESSGERNEIIAASATSDLGWPREHVLCFAPTRSGKGVSWLSKKSSRPAARTCLVHARALADLQSAFAQMLHLEFNDVSLYTSDVGGFSARANNFRQF